MQTSAFPDGKLLVFALPTSLSFYADDKSTHKQIVTIYNPYDFPVKFQVLSTAPTKYGVCDHKGVIKPKYSVEIVVRHNAISPENYGRTDKIRLVVQDYINGSLTGKKDVVCTLHASRPEPPIYQPEPDFEEMSGDSGSRARQYQIGSIERGAPNRQGSRPSMVIIMAAVASLIVLMLPSIGDADSSLPTYLHLTVPPKLVAAYILGLVTMAILKN